MLIARKIALDRNKAQEEDFRKSCGTKLFAWIGGWPSDSGSTSKAASRLNPHLRKHLNSLKREQFYADVQGDQMCGAGSAYRPWRGSLEADRGLRPLSLIPTTSSLRSAFATPSESI